MPGIDAAKRPFDRVARNSGLPGCGCAERPPTDAGANAHTLRGHPNPIGNEENYKTPKIYDSQQIAQRFCADSVIGETMGIKTLFIMMAMVMGPEHQDAKPDAPENSRVIVKMVGRDKILTIGSTSRGLAYTVADSSGKTLLNAGTIDDLRQHYPDLWQHLQNGVATADAPAHAEIIDASVNLDAGF